MSANTKPADGLTPSGLLKEMGKSSIVLWIAVAAAIHVVVIGGSSVGYIWDRWVDPEGAAERKAKALVAKEELKKKASPAPSVPAAASTTAVAAASAPSASASAAPAAAPGAGATSTPAVAGGTVSGKPDEIPEALKNSEMVKSITKTVKPSETPKQPDLGAKSPDIFE